MSDTGRTWAYIFWQPPPPPSTNFTTISRFLISATYLGEVGNNLNIQINTTGIGDLKVSTLDNVMRFNVTGLFPATNYEFRVQTIASFLDSGNVMVDNPGNYSNPVTATTETDSELYYYYSDELI